MMDLKDTQTEKNLYRAFTSEALAHLKYQFYKKELLKEHQEYKEILDEIIHNEKEHGKIWFKLLNNPNNKNNLEDAVYGEFFEHKEMYPTFSAIAEEEGFHEIAELFKKVGEIEGDHFEEFDLILTEMEDKDKEMNTVGEWKCLNCGYIVDGEKPSECPVCEHPSNYFKLLSGVH